MPIVLSSVVLGKFENYLLSKKMNFNDLINLAPSEYNWYGEFLFFLKPFEIIPVDGFFAEFHTERIYQNSRRRIDIQDLIDKGYLGIVMQNGWVKDNIYKPALLIRAYKLFYSIYDKLHTRDFSISQYINHKIKWFFKKITNKISNPYCLFLFITHRVKPNTVLLMELNPCHTEVMPGYTKYLLDSGFNVDTLMIPEMSKEKVFCKYKHKNVKHFKIDRESIKKLQFSKKLNKYTHICVTSWHLYYQNIATRKNFQTFPEFYPNLNTIKSRLIFVVHEQDDLSNYITQYSFISLAPLGGKYKPVVVNPHYYGSIKITPKNEKIIHFIIVGNLEKDRRNYELLNRACDYLINLNITNFKITVIGRGEAMIKNVFKSYFNLLGRCSFPKMYSHLEQADFFLALLDPDNEEHNGYLEKRTSGSFQLCYGFLKPIIIAEKFITKPGFANNNSIVYSNNNEFGQALEKAIKMSQSEYKLMQKELLKLSQKISSESIINLKTIFYKLNNVV